KGAALHAVTLGAKDKELAPLVKELPVPNISLSRKTAHPLCVTVVNPADRTGNGLHHHCMIREQSTIPAEKVDRFTPAEDFQPGVRVDVTQGVPGTEATDSDVLYSVELPITPLAKEARRSSIEVRYIF